MARGSTARSPHRESKKKKKALDGVRSPAKARRAGHKVVSQSTRRSEGTGLTWGTVLTAHQARAGQGSIGAAPAPAPAPAPRFVEGVYGISYDIYCPPGGIRTNIPAGHPHAGRPNIYYYGALTQQLQQWGYQHLEYSIYTRRTTRLNAVMQARLLQAQPTLTWMAIPGVMRAMHVVQIHTESLYPPQGAPCH